MEWTEVEIAHICYRITWRLSMNVYFVNEIFQFWSHCFRKCDTRFQFIHQNWWWTKPNKITNKYLFKIITEKIAENGGKKNLRNEIEIDCFVSCEQCLDIRWKISIQEGNDRPFNMIQRKFPIPIPQLESKLEQISVQN